MIEAIVATLKNAGTAAGGACGVYAYQGDYRGAFYLLVTSLALTFASCFVAAAVKKS